MKFKILFVVALATFMFSMSMNVAISGDQYSCRRMLCIATWDCTCGLETTTCMGPCYGLQGPPSPCMPPGPPAMGEDCPMCILHGGVPDCYEVPCICSAIDL